MLTSTAFLAVLAGLIRPQWIRNKTAFGWGIVLVVAEVLAETIGVGTSAMWMAAFRQYSARGDIPGLGTEWYVVMALLAPAIKVLLVVVLIRAFWPGGRLFCMCRGNVLADGECGAPANVEEMCSADTDNERER